MNDHTTEPESAPDETDRLHQLKSLSREGKAKVDAENARLRSERNARRWKAQRDPVEYEKQKIDQREQYAVEIAANEGREVRSYRKVEAASKIERDAIRRERNAKAKRDSRTNATPEEKAARADAMWRKRALERGLTPDEVVEGLATLRRNRKYKAASYPENSNFGLF